MRFYLIFAVTGSVVMLPGLALLGMRFFWAIGWAMARRIKYVPLVVMPPALSLLVIFLGCSLAGCQPGEEKPSQTRHPDKQPPRPVSLEASSAAFSPDSKLLLVGYNMRGDAETPVGPIKLWDVEAHKQLREFTGHGAVVTFVGFLPDSKHAITGGNDQVLAVRDVTTGVIVRSMHWEEEDWVLCGGVSSDGKIAVTGHRSGLLRVWDVTTAKLVRTIGVGIDRLPHLDRMALSPDGKVAVSRHHPLSDEDFGIAVWDVGTGQLIRSYKGESYLAHVIGIAPDGKSVLFNWDSDRGNVVSLWDVASGREIRKVGDGTGIWAASFASDGKRLFLGGSSLSLWNVEKSQKLWSVDTDSEYSYHFAFSSDCKLVFGATGINGRGKTMTLKLWNALDGKELATWEDHDR